MEWTGRDGRRWPWSRGYSEHTGSSSYTNSSGTTGYTTSTNSRMPWMSMEAARHFQEMEMEDTVSWEMEAVMDLEFLQSPKETAIEKKMKQIKIVAKEFKGAESVKCRTEGGDLSVLERWFAELGVGWVLHVADGTPAGELEHALDASSWISTVNEIVDTFRPALLRLLVGHGPGEEEEPATESEEQNMAEHLQHASFTQQAMVKMLTFVDFIVAPNLTREVVFITDGVPVAVPYQKLQTLLLVRETLSEALSEIRMPFDLSSFAEVARIHDEIVNILTAKEGKVRTAIWIEMLEIRTRILESPEDGQGSSDAQTPQGSSGIDKATTSAMMYLMLLHHFDYWSVESIVSEAASLGKYVPQVGGLPPLTSLAVDMVSCLEEKLANKSKAFPDQGLKFLFLLNNSFYIEDKLHGFTYYPSCFPESYKVNLAGKIKGYMGRYIQVSWAPVLSCLINHTPNCLGKTYSSLPKFESEFQKMYNTHKLWKVPNPKLRNRLRRAIIDEVIPCYTRYLADDYGNDPLKLSPSYLQEMLQELFEG